jgi:hypothetical protein
MQGLQEQISLPCLQLVQGLIVLLSGGMVLRMLTPERWEALLIPIQV